MSYEPNQTAVAEAPVPASEPSAPSINEGTHIPGEQAPASRPDDTTARARAMGWVPREEYKGNPDNWREADEFVRRGEEILPIVQERNRDLTRRLTELEQRLGQKEAEYSTTISNLERMSGLALQKQRETLIASFDGAMRNAAAAADVERFDQLQRDKFQAVSDFDRRVYENIQPRQQQAPQEQQGQPVPKEVGEWISRNDWYQKDQALQLEAQAIHVQLAQEHPYMSLSENLARVEQAIKQRHPRKFGVTQPQPSMTYGAVEGGSTRMPSGGSRQRGVNDLPADALAQADKFIKQGLFKDRAEYAKLYYEQN